MLLDIAFGFGAVWSLDAQSGNPAGLQLPPPKAIYTPAPVYRAEWARKGLTGKGVVLVTIDTQTGKVTGARMSKSTGNKQLDAAALEAYSRWRFKPGSVPQVKMPIEFAARARPQPAKRSLSQPLIILILLVLAVAATGILRKKTNVRFKSWRSHSTSRLAGSNSADEATDAQRFLSYNGRNHFAYVLRMCSTSSIACVF